MSQKGLFQEMSNELESISPPVNMMYREGFTMPLHVKKKKR